MLKRGRGRPRGGGKSKLFGQVPRRTATTSEQDVETSGFPKEFPELYKIQSTPQVYRQSRLSRNPHERPRVEFLVPTATEILEAADKLNLSRTNLRALAFETQGRQGRPVGSRNKAIVTNSDQIAAVENGTLEG